MRFAIIGIPKEHILSIIFQISNALAKQTTVNSRVSTL